MNSRRVRGVFPRTNNKSPTILVRTKKIQTLLYLMLLASSRVCGVFPRTNNQSPMFLVRTKEVQTLLYGHTFRQIPGLVHIQAQ